MVIVVNLEHKMNVLSEIFSTDAGIDTECKKQQLLNASSEIEVIPSDMVIEWRAVQPRNAPSPIVVTLYCKPS
jgi:hypothetical protein